MKSENTVVGLIGEMLNPVSEITGPKANAGLKLKSENAVVGSIGEMLNPVSEITGPKANAGLKLKSENAVVGPNANGDGDGVRDLGNGSSVVYFPRFLSYEKSWEYFHYLDKHIPWTRPTIYVFGKPFVQPRDVCYIASKGLKELIYSGHKPDAHSWDDYPPLKEILEEVHKAFPGSHFNSLLINRYNSGNDYVGWHADDEKLYGPNPEIASISFGCERDFFLKTKSQGEVVREPPSKRAKKNKVEKHCFKLKHGSLLLMRGNTQRDWLHSVPKRAKAESARINLTFRRVMQMSSRRLLL
ncbi:putative DNA oxidative demethylase [Helianthus annuus]|uniref:DNA oxidative demethylase n=1 Tax=Helianthus annuus TaxID=4232 RepID=A0A9K3IWK3_HELAN|nr:putative DNA oxidative demethylase [Helianthus annuus]